MNSKVYKWCAVPQCKNTSVKTPNKLFVYVPNEKTMRNKWLKLARRDPSALSQNSSIYFCEDHFDYHVMGSVSQVHMKTGCIPTRFECQADRKRRTSDTTHRPYILKKRRMMAVEECEKKLNKRSVTEHLEATESLPKNLAFHEINLREETTKKAEKSIQVFITPKFRSKATQTEMKLVNKMTSPLKPTQKSVSTSPFKVEISVSRKPSISNISKASRKIFTKGNNSDSDISYAAYVTSQKSSSSTKSLQISTSDCSELKEDDKKQEALKILEVTLMKVVKNPRYYLGVPKTCYYLMELIEEHTKISVNHILLCFKKIRLNNPFRELADDFSMHPTYASKTFLKNIPILASIMRPFLVILDQENIKRMLPMAFRHKYNRVIVASLTIWK